MFLLRMVPYPDDGPHKGPRHIGYNKWLVVLEYLLSVDIVNVTGWQPSHDLSSYVSTMLRRHMGLL